ncbi:HAD family hydrolase [Dyadobacter sp. 50-39]|uniref:HAD family hydrolase n=1 Tax=Dyadobacter sp. 50-39 TaxID=1895756 RepID=UPI000965FC39|nr:HAD family hydrolase [Dyadobacter sp. 50-39]OJV22434.1 MAG: dehalogenase [Dyadobacter sp. 50-39]
MKYYKHYSFDLWLTLIKSNPNFKEKRTLFFYENYNFHKKPLNEVGTIFRKVDLMCNAINEKTGKNIDSSEMYLMVISIINDYTISFDDIDLDYIACKMQDLLFEYMPLIYCSETKAVLEYLKATKGNTLSILSNTGFIPGKLLRSVLKHICIDMYFDFQIYSDEVGLSKPNKDIFKLMVNKITENRQILLSEIVHIGDNVRADVIGANSLGIQSILINSNNNSITSIIT